MRAASGSAFARAALAGNPSDGYGGRTLAVPIRDFMATARVEPSGAPELDPGAEPLIRAALARFERIFRPVRPCRIRVETTVPRQLGLAGSSAIVIAVLRALAAAGESPIDRRTLAREALAAETEELGIAAGPQDRLVQSFEQLLYMDFSADAIEPLPAELLPPLVVAHRADMGEPSGTLHGDLRRRFDAREPAVVAAMQRLAGLTSEARDALLAGDQTRFAACLDASFDVRAAIVELDPRDARGVAIARAHGLHANYAGSGGAVVGVLGGADHADLRAAYEAAGWRLVAPATVA